MAHEQLKSEATETVHYTDALVRFAVGTGSGSIPGGVLHATKRVLMDTIGCAIAGLDTKIGDCLVKLKMDEAGSPESTLFGSSSRLPCSSVSYIHSHAANALDADETLLHRSHFACCIALPVLAYAEKLGSSGSGTLSAIAIGFDIAARINLALPLYDVTSSGELKFVPVQGYSPAAIGTAAGVGRLLRLSDAKMAHAFAIAYASTPLQRRRSRSREAMTKYAMYGQIAVAGANAAMLAHSGFTGDAGILDADMEFWLGFGSSSCDYDFMMKDIGEHWFITETSFKSYPACRQANVAIDLFTGIVDTHKLSLADIEQVTVRIPPSRLIRDLVELRAPKSSADAPFSIPYAFAMVAAGIPPGPKWFQPKTFTDPGVTAFMNKVTPEIVPSWMDPMIEEIRMAGTYYRIPTEVIVRTSRGTFSQFGEYARGNPWKPGFVTSDEALSAKFAEFTSGRLGPDAIERAIETIYRLDRLDHVSELMRCLAAAPDGRSGRFEAGAVR